MDRLAIFRLHESAETLEVPLEGSWAYPPGRMDVRGLGGAATLALGAMMVPRTITTQVEGGPVPVVRGASYECESMTDIGHFVKVLGYNALQTSFIEADPDNAFHTIEPDLTFREIRGVYNGETSTLIMAIDDLRHVQLSIDPEKRGVHVLPSSEPGVPFHSVLVTEVKADGVLQIRVFRPESSAPQGCTVEVLVSQNSEPIAFEGTQSEYPLKSHDHSFGPNYLASQYFACPPRGPIPSPPLESSSEVPDDESHLPPPPESSSEVLVPEGGLYEVSEGGVQSGSNLPPLHEEAQASSEVPEGGDPLQEAPSQGGRLEGASSVVSEGEQSPALESTTEGAGSQKVKEKEKKKKVKATRDASQTSLLGLKTLIQTAFQPFVLPPLESTTGGSGSRSGSRSHRVPLRGAEASSGEGSKKPIRRLSGLKQRIGSGLSTGSQMRTEGAQGAENKKKEKVEEKKKKVKATSQTSLLGSLLQTLLPPLESTTGGSGSHRVPPPGAEASSGQRRTPRSPPLSSRINSETPGAEASKGLFECGVLTVLHDMGKGGGGKEKEEGGGEEKRSGWPRALSRIGRVGRGRTTSGTEGLPSTGSQMSTEGAQGAQNKKKEKVEETKVKKKEENNKKEKKVKKKKRDLTEFIPPPSLFPVLHEALFAD